jgi:CHAD domain-containing protein
LRSKKYLTTLAKWESYLSATAPDKADEQNEYITVKELADRRIKKTYKEIIKLGNKIDQHSPPEALHSLRKMCKRLRYLMEFFQNLYPERRINKLIASLKKLQDVLGDYQDYAVQQEQLQQFSGEMQETNTPNKTFLAMGVLIQEFENRKCQARNRFDAQFMAFKKANTKGLI